MNDPHAGQPVVAAGAPFGEGAGVVIMIHGRGAGPRNILDLLPRFDRPTFTYLAPAAAGGTWYPLSFLADIPRNEPFLSSALRAIERLVDDVVARGVAHERICLVGFSQGACLTSEFVARHPARYGGVIAFTGGLVGPPGTPREYPGSLDGTPIFLGCSDVDAHVPLERVEETAGVFSAMGARVDLRVYPGMGHLVNDDEIDAARGILDQIC